MYYYSTGRTTECSTVVQWQPERGPKILRLKHIFGDTSYRGSKVKKIKVISKSVCKNSNTILKMSTIFFLYNIKLLCTENVLSTYRYGWLKDRKTIRNPPPLGALLSNEPSRLLLFPPNQSIMRKTRGSGDNQTLCTYSLQHARRSVIQWQPERYELKHPCVFRYKTCRWEGEGTLCSLFDGRRRYVFRDDKTR